MKQIGANKEANFFMGIIPQGGKAPIILSPELVANTGAFGLLLSKSIICLSLKNSKQHISIMS
jgi:hypothetical protein